MSAAISFADVVCEIEALHDAFAVWMGPGGDDAVFARFETALAPEFTMVGPGGQRLDRAGVLDMLKSRKAAFGSDFAIRIEGAVALAAGSGFVAAGYDEIQANRPGPRRRRATALFRPDPAGPNGMRWLAVHETWLPDTA